jgi:NhaP-type Na+/H+ or K+/H+ antiporter
VAGRLGVSGPIAVVVAGILIGNNGMESALTEATGQHLMTFWRLVEEILNALLFLIIGLEIAAIDLDRRSVIVMAAMIPTVLVIRWLSVRFGATAQSAPSAPIRLLADPHLGWLARRAVGRHGAVSAGWPKQGFNIDDSLWDRRVFDRSPGPNPCTSRTASPVGSG